MGKHQATLTVTFEFDSEDAKDAVEFVSEVARTLQYQGVGFLADNGYVVENVSATMQSVRVEATRHE